MRQLVLAIVLLVLSSFTASADTLTTPLATTATQYVIQTVTFNLISQTIEIHLVLLDSSGITVKTIDTQITFSTLPLTSVQQTTLAGWIVNYLKSQGIIN